jgi:hypothetical protein
MNLKHKQSRKLDAFFCFFATSAKLDTLISRIGSASEAVGIKKNEPSYFHHHFFLGQGPGSLFTRRWGRRCELVKRMFNISKY